MGTPSTLLFERPRDVVNSNFDDWPFLSVHFWGEKAEGRWTLQVVNDGNRHVNSPGILKKWQLIFYGTVSNPIRLRHNAVNVQESSLMYPESSSFYQQSNLFNPGFQNYPGVYSGAGSELKPAIAALDQNDSLASTTEIRKAVGNKQVIKDECNEECVQGCYGPGPSECVKCKHYQIDNTCVKTCPPRSYATHIGDSCKLCHESCETCTGPGQDNCISCAPAHYMVTDLGVCLQMCPDGYYTNIAKKSCIPCQSNCANCQDSPDHCTSCDHHLVLYNKKCYAACPMDTYETEDYGCVACSSNCETCNGPNSTDCVTCRSGYYFLNNSCFNSCPEGYYADKKRKECLKCPHGCSTCNSAVCLKCDRNWTVNKKGHCIPDSNCSKGLFFSKKWQKCLECDSSCETCDEEMCLSCTNPLILQDGKCLRECSKGYYGEQGICVPCLHMCQECVSRGNCTICKPGLHLQNGECRVACADGYYSDRGICSKCYLSCKTCSGPRKDQCVTCPEGWQLAVGECHLECPVGFYKGKSGCQKCHHYCRTCKGDGPLQCTSCAEGYMLDGGLCMECLPSQYYDPASQLCKSCHESCKSCSGSSKFSCLSCDSPLSFDRLNNRCVPCCESNVTDDCCNCDPKTGKCKNPAGTGKRRISEAVPLQTAGSLVTTTALLAVCLAVVVIFVFVFVILQLRSKVPRTTWPRKNTYEDEGSKSIMERASLIQNADDDEDETEVKLFTRT